MPRYGMVIDITKCNGCHNCFLACRDEYTGNTFLPYSVSQPLEGPSWIQVLEKERGRYPKVKVAFTPVPCMHCEEAACVKAAPDGAIYKRPDGIVLVDPKKSEGQKRLVSTCPYRVIHWNEAKGVPQKCTFCAHLLDRGWKEPRCVEVCPTGALVFGDLDRPNSDVARWMASGRTEILHPEYGMQEKVVYIGIPKRFIAGAVVFGDTDQCGQGAKVTLEGEGEKWEMPADNYGDFEFEGLSADKPYVVKVEQAGYKAYQTEVKTKIDVYLGDIVLAKAARPRKKRPL